MVVHGISIMKRSNSYASGFASSDSLVFTKDAILLDTHLKDLIVLKRRNLE